MQPSCSGEKTSFSERAGVLSKAAELARARREQLARLNTLETGKLIAEALWEVESIAQIFEYYAKNGERLLEPERLPVDDPMAGDAVLVYEPLGIVYEVEPWNVPFFQIVRPLAAQLMAGNTVLLKHASNVPQCSAAMEQLMKDAGLPDGVFTNLYVTHDQSDRIIGDPRVCGVTLTGSEAAGASVAAQAGMHVKKSVLELGGSDAMIVLEDADLDQAVKGAMMGRLTLSGQACVGDKRMIVADPIYDAFLAGLTAAIQALQPGDPMDLSTTFASGVFSNGCRYDQRADPPGCGAWGYCDRSRKTGPNAGRVCAADPSSPVSRPITRSSTRRSSARC